MRRFGAWPLHLTGALVWGIACGGAVLVAPWRSVNALAGTLTVARRHQEVLKERADFLQMMDVRFRDWREHGRHTMQPVELPRLFRDLSQLCRRHGTRLMFVRQTGSAPLQGVPGAHIRTIEVGTSGEFKALFDWLNGIETYPYAAIPESLQIEPGSTADAPVAVQVQLRVYVVDPAAVPAPRLRGDEVHRFLRSLQ